MHAGPGFGGSCFPKDTRALVKIAQDYDVQLRIVEAVLAVNDSRKRAMSRKVANAAGNLRGKTVAVLGLTFKPDTDDMREAPSIPLVTGLLDMGAKVRAHDPVGMEQARKELPDIEYVDDPYECVKGADAMVVVTEWVQYRTLDLARLKQTMAQPVVVDLRNIYSPEDMAEHGFVYDSVGRAPVQHLRRSADRDAMARRPSATRAVRYRRRRYLRQMRSRLGHSASAECQSGPLFHRRRRVDDCRASRSRREALDRVGIDGGHQRIVDGGGDQPDIGQDLAALDRLAHST